ncbi:MAG: DUF3048 domain-containing protein [Acidimicrobiales bacterium]
MELNQRRLAVAGGVLVALIAIVGIALAVTGGGDDAAPPATTDAPTTVPTTDAPTTTVADGPYAPLTGEPVPEGSPLLTQPAIVVKISNNYTVAADAMIGIDRADIVVEERIEANFTRFAAIFHSDLPEEVGPIRSGRTTDLDLLANLGEPILVYSGANPSVSGQLRGLEGEGRVKLVVDRATNVDLVRNTAYGRPDNLFSNLPEILDKYGSEAGVAVPLFDYRHESFERSGGLPGDGVTITGSNIVSFVWDPAQGYVRVQDGEIHDNRGGEPIAVDNVVLLETEYRRSAVEAESVDAQTVGTGRFTLLVGGARLEGTWTRATRDDRYTFTDPAGNLILLDPGSTWVSLVPADSYDFAVDAETSALVLEAEG